MPLGPRGLHEHGAGSAPRIEDSDITTATIMLTNKAVVGGLTVTRGWLLLVFT
jgi:hypothetical protein